MYLKQINIFLLIMLWGVPVMSIETGFNQELKERFKKSIGYSTLLEHSPAEKLVVIDWKKILGNIIDGEKLLWVGKVYEPSLSHSGQGEIKARLESAKGVAIVKITSLSGNWKQRLDHVMWVESLTNRPEINLKVKPAMSDLYLIPKDSSHIAFVSFLYGGFHVDVSEWEDADVGALAESILKIMQDHSRPPAKISPKFSIATDKNKIKVGGSFTIKVKGISPDWSSEWVYVQTEDLLPDSVELTEREGDLFTFKALKKGEVNINFTAMNTRTLLLSNESIAVCVE
jgi:hypothetical protein